MARNHRMGMRAEGVEDTRRAPQTFVGRNSEGVTKRAYYCPNGVNLKSGWRLFSSADNLTTVRGNEIIPEARIKNNF